MKIRTLVAVASLPCIALVAYGLARASVGPVGEWKIADGSANVAIRPCGPSLCGFVSWAKDSADAVGRQVMLNMKPQGHLWFGTVVNVIDGQRYTAQMSLLGERTLKVEGCVEGGSVCGGQQWARVR